MKYWHCSGFEGISTNKTALIIKADNKRTAIAIIKSTLESMGIEPNQDFNLLNITVAMTDSDVYINVLADGS